jgi:hypothetical protein
MLPIRLAHIYPIKGGDIDPSGIAVKVGSYTKGLRAIFQRFLLPKGTIGI